MLPIVGVLLNSSKWSKFYPHESLFRTNLHFFHVDKCFWRYLMPHNYHTFRSSDYYERRNIAFEYTAKLSNSDGWCLVLFYLFIFVFYLKDRTLRLQWVQNLPGTWQNHDQSWRKGEFLFCISCWTIRFLILTIRDMYSLLCVTSSLFLSLDIHFPQFKMRARSFNEEEPP